MRAVTKARPIDATRLRHLLDYDPETGTFRWLVDRRGHARAGMVAGRINPSTGYLVIKIDGRGYRGHRLAWLYMTGEWPSETIDHINAAPGDNRWGNLREASLSENNCNRSKQSNNTSGRKGVFRHTCTRKWRAQIGINGRPIHLGYFDTAEEAHAAYSEAAKSLHGKFARTE